MTREKELEQQVALLRKTLALVLRLSRGKDFKHILIDSARPRQTLGRFISRVIEDTRPYKGTM